MDFQKKEVVSMLMLQISFLTIYGLLNVLFMSHHVRPNAANFLYSMSHIRNKGIFSNG